MFLLSTIKICIDILQSKFMIVTVNLCAYLTWLTVIVIYITKWGTVACTRSISERVICKVYLTMTRLTNLFYKSMAGFEVPIMLWLGTYVVVPKLKYLKQPAPVRRIVDEGSKVRIRRMTMKFGIPRNMEILGERRTRSTNFNKIIIRKGSSLISEGNFLLLGNYGTSQLEILKSKIKIGEKGNNLSIIMSDPQFLVACWVKIRSNKGALTKALTNNTLDGINEKWFQEVSNTFRNGSFEFSPARKTYIKKKNGKARVLIMPSPKDKIVQEAMRTLLELIFEPQFSESSHGWRPNKSCSTALKQIKYKFGSTKWLIEGDIKDKFPNVNHKILTSLISKKVDDQPFIDLIYKYLRTGYGEHPKQIQYPKIGLMQGGILSPLLANIYMDQFDLWMENKILEFSKGTRRKANPAYTKMIRSSYSVNKTIPTGIANDPNYRRLAYTRYGDDFLIGAISSKQECLILRNQIKEFLWDNLELTLNLDKTKITHATKSSALFLGYVIHISPISKHQIKKNKNGKLVRRIPRPLFDAPIKDIVEKLKENKFANKIGNPTRNGKLIHLSLKDIIEYYRSVERGILNYYSLASNYGRASARIHYILKYSCALTIASKMKLRTKKKVFSKYTIDLRIKNEKGEITCSYPTISYKKPSNTAGILKFDNNLVGSLSKRFHRGSRDLYGPCTLCGTTSNIEIHHVKSLRKGGNKNDFLGAMNRRMNRKQIPLCTRCHILVHQGKYDGSTAAF